MLEAAGFGVSGFILYTGSELFLRLFFALGICLFVLKSLEEVSVLGLTFDERFVAVDKGLEPLTASCGHVFSQIRLKKHPPFSRFFDTRISVSVLSHVGHVRAWLWA